MGHTPSDLHILHNMCLWVSIYSNITIKGRCDQKLYSVNTGISYIIIFRLNCNFLYVDLYNKNMYIMIIPVFGTDITCAYIGIIYSPIEWIEWIFVKILTGKTETYNTCLDIRQFTTYQITKWDTSQISSENTHERILMYFKCRFYDASHWIRLAVDNVSLK